LCGNRMRSRRTETEEAGNERDKGKARTLASAAASQLIGIVAVFEVLCGSTSSCCPWFEIRDGSSLPRAKAIQVKCLWCVDSGVEQSGSNKFEVDEKGEKCWIE
jgi:hypothetical protein